LSGGRRRLEIEEEVEAVGSSSYGEKKIHMLKLLKTHRC
jgi:hypothetical protein